MRHAYLILASLLALLCAPPVCAQTSDFHMTLGASPERGLPPTEMDMSWAGGNGYVLPPGTTIQAFVLWGDFGRAGQWLSKYLPEETRAGRTLGLMFEDGKWQPIKPVGVRHGLEIAFAEKMAALMPDGVVGVIVSAGSPDEVNALVARAKEGARCDLLGVVRLRERGQDATPLHAVFSENLDKSNFLLIDMSPLIAVSRTDLDRSAMVRGKGEAMAMHVFRELNQITKDK